MRNAGNRLGRLIATGPSLRWRIISVLLIASLLPLAIAGFGAWIVFGSLLEQKALERMQTVVRSHAQAIEQHLTERKHLLKMTAESNSLIEISQKEKARELLDNLNEVTSGSFVDLGVIGESGNHLVYIGPYDLEARNYADAPWFKEVMSRGSFVSDVFMGFRNVPHCVIAVRTSKNGVTWILRATINSEKFNSLVQSHNLGKNSDAYIVNSSGVYQTAPKGGNILDTLSGVIPEYRRGVTDSRFEKESITQIRVTTWINDNRWILAVEQDLDTIQEPVDQAIADGAKVVVVAVILLILTTVFATWHLTGQIDKANTEREEMSRAFMRSAKLASIGELATGLAHEINNPLAVISAEQTNMTDVLSDCPELPQKNEILESIARCRNQVSRCAGITRKMLQFGRNRETSLEKTDIRPRLQEIINLLKRQANVRNVELTLNAPEHLPDAIIDPIEFEQVVVNLINNAIDALPNGGRIDINVSNDKDAILLEIADNGIGIPKEIIDRVFEPFFTTKPVGKGTGLGLSVCFGIVHSWGGNIRVDSKPGHGTRMLLTIPLENKNRV